MKYSSAQALIANGPTKTNTQIIFEHIIPSQFCGKSIIIFKILSKNKTPSRVKIKNPSITEIFVYIARPKKNFRQISFILRTVAYSHY